MKDEYNILAFVFGLIFVCYQMIMFFRFGENYFKDNSSGVVYVSTYWINFFFACIGEIAIAYICRTKKK